MKFIVLVLCLGTTTIWCAVGPIEKAYHDIKSAEDAVKKDMDLMRQSLMKLVTNLQNQQQQFTDPTRTALTNLQQEVKTVSGAWSDAQKNMSKTVSTLPDVRTPVSDMFNAIVGPLLALSRVTEQGLINANDADSIISHILKEIQLLINDITKYVNSVKDGSKTVESIVKPLVAQEHQAGTAAVPTTPTTPTAAGATAQQAAQQAAQAAGQATTKVEQGLKTLGKVLGVGK